jgi:tRNA(Ile)-lysidine synthase
MTLDLAALEAALAAEFSDWRRRQYCVALSGGLDSTVLLHLAAGALPDGLRAVHVDHGLHTDSGDWRDSAAAFCAALGVPFIGLAVKVDTMPGESPEAAARGARYGALAAALEPGEVLLTAHHADDQAETVLLQLLRGAGPAGLAAMPASATFADGRLCRPLLGFERAALENYARRHGLAWREDPSNADIRADRNFLRHRVLPRLRERWPSLTATIGRSARHSAAAADLVRRQATADLGDCLHGETLALAPLRELSRVRARAVVRHWVLARGLPPPDSRHTERLLDELTPADGAGGGRVDWSGAGVRRFRDRLFLLDEEAGNWLDNSPAPLSWQRPGRLSLGPGLGELWADPAAGEGCVADLWRRGPVDVRWRCGGERISPGRGRPRRRLKSLLREAGVPPWLRDRLPLIYVGGELAAVGDLWLSGDWQARPDEPGYRLRWAARPELGLGAMHGNKD